MKTLFTKCKQFVQTHPRLCEAIFLILIFLISLVIRRIGLKFGFPLLTHPDEDAIIDPVIKMTKFHTLNSGNFNRPDQVLQYLNLIYLNTISFILYGQNVAEAFADHYLTFYFYARLLIAVLASLVPVAAYKIGKEIKPKLALTSTIIFALFPLFIKYSLSVTPDVPITLFTLLVIYFALRYLKTNQEKFIIFATIFVAINTAEKYPGLLSFAIVMAAIGLQVYGNETNTTKPHFRIFMLRTIKMAFIFILTLFIIAPYLFLDYSSVIAALIKESRSYHLGADNLGFFGNLWFYIRTFYDFTGPLGVILVLVGIYAFIKNFTKQNTLLLYGFLYWIFISALALHWERWSLPMYIAPLFLIAIGINYLLEKREKVSLVINLLGGLIILLFIVQQGITSIYIPIQKKYLDIRVISTEYFDVVGINRGNSVYDGYTPLEPNKPKKIVEDYYKEVHDKDYIIISSFIYDRYFAEPGRYQDSIDIYNEIRESYPLIKTFTPYPLSENTLGQLENILYFFKYRLGLTSEVRYSGPTIEIYQITD